jgi:hypothetical protein
MPNLFVVTDQKDLESVASHLLRGRVSAANRAAALDALRLANPTLDLDRLSPGAVVVVPADLPGLRRDASDDAIGAAATDLFDPVTSGLAALVTAVDDAERTRRLEQRDAEVLLDSEIVRRMASSDRQLAATIEEARATFEADAVQAKEQRAALKRASGRWAEELEALRLLLS